MVQRLLYEKTRPFGSSDNFTKAVIVMEALWQDLRFALRTIKGNLYFSIIALIALALGIGANSAIFTMVYAVLIKPLPFHAPERLVLLWQQKPNSGFPQLPFSFPNYTDVKERQTVFEDIAAWRSFAENSFNLSGSDQPIQINYAEVSAGLFTVLGVQPVQGRTFLAAEDEPGGDRVVVIGYDLWRSHFNTDPQAVGKSVRLNGENYTVIGIMPAGFNFPRFSAKPIDAWVALSREPDPTQARKFARGASSLSLIGRLKPGVSSAQAQAEMSALAQRLGQEHPRFNSGLNILVSPLHNQLTGQIRPALLILFGAVALVLLIACVNVANIMLARASARQKEIAIRLSLGATRWRIVRQLLTESVLLALMGGGLGLILALWLLHFLTTIPYYAPSYFIPYSVAATQITLNIQVVLFTITISAATGILFGLAPALQATKPDLNAVLKENSSALTGALGKTRLRAFFVITELALSLVLLVGAGLLIKSFARLISVDPGFRAENVLAAEINLPRNRYRDSQQLETFQRELLLRVSAMPGVESAGLSSMLPFSGNDVRSDLFIEGQPQPTGSNDKVAHYRSITPDYLTVMGVPLKAGRAFSERDSADAPRVAIINETMARLYWPNENPLGKRLALSIEALKFPAPNRPPIMDVNGAYREIVGIVQDIRHHGLDSAARPELYLPMAQRPSAKFDLVVKTAADNNELTMALRKQVLAIDPEQAVADVRPLSAYISDATAKPRFNFLLLALFALIALVLSAIGIYGIVSYNVTQRWHEIGIRMALGASNHQIIRMVLTEAGRLIAVGIGAGSLCAVALTRLMASILFGVSALDLSIFAAAAVVLALVALLACYWPARRATQVDPIIALRYE